MNNLKQVIPSTVREAVGDVSLLPMTDPVNTMRLVTNPAQFGIYAFDGSNWNYVKPSIEDQAKQIYVAKVATTGPLPGSPVYDNGTGGIDATLSGTGALSVIDNVILEIGDIILVWKEVDQKTNGIYEVLALSPNYILKRIFSYDQTTEISNSIVNVELGQQNGSRGFFQTTENPVVGVDNIVFSSIEGASTVNLFSSTNLIYTATPVAYPISSPRQGFFANNLFFVGTFSDNYVVIDNDGNLVQIAPKQTTPAKEAPIYINRRKQRIYVADNINFYIYSFGGTLLNTFSHGVTSLKTGIVAEHDRVGIVDFETGLFRIHNELTGALIGTISVGSAFQAIMANYYDGFVYIGTNNSIRKVSMRSNLSQQTISGTGRVQKVIKTGNLLITNQITANAVTYIDNTNFVSGVTQNVLAQPRGLDTNAYLLGVGYYSSRVGVFYDPYDMKPLYTTPTLSSDCHCFIFGNNSALVLGENGTGFLVKISGGIKIPPFGTTIWHDTATNNTYVAVSNGLIKRIDAF